MAMCTIQCYNWLHLPTMLRLVKHVHLTVDFTESFGPFDTIIMKNYQCFNFWDDEITCIHLTQMNDKCEVFNFREKEEVLPKVCAAFTDRLYDTQLGSKTLPKNRYFGTFQPFFYIM